MKYDEYLKCARKHLLGCESLLNSYTPGKTTDLHVWLELYYLSGYILEGIIVYSAYKLNNWKPEKDIQTWYDIPFTNRTNLDFYVTRIDKKTNEKVFRNRSLEALSVQQHKFNAIVERLLKTNSSFKGVPYLGDGEIDDDVKKLITDWKPDVRYNYNAKNLPSLNKDIIARLIKTCKNIYLKHI